MKTEMIKCDNPTCGELSRVDLATLEESCPRCDAESGETCMTKNGTSSLRFHTQRRATALHKLREESAAIQREEDQDAIQ